MSLIMVDDEIGDGDGSVGARDLNIVHSRFTRRENTTQPRNRHVYGDQLIDHQNSSVPGPLYAPRLTPTCVSVKPHSRTSREYSQASAAHSIDAHHLVLRTQFAAELASPLLVS
jgi:hypothetical protein